MDAVTAVFIEFYFDKYADSDFYPRKMRDILDALSDETKPFPLKYLVGRGSGLTPSGDDMITGILYVDALSPFVSEKHKKTLNSSFLLGTSKVHQLESMLVKLLKVESYLLSTQVLHTKLLVSDISVQVQ